MKCQHTLSICKTIYYVNKNTSNKLLQKLTNLVESCLLLHQYSFVFLPYHMPSPFPVHLLLVPSATLPVADNITVTMVTNLNTHIMNQF